VFKTNYRPEQILYLKIKLKPAVVDYGCPETVMGKAWLGKFGTSTDQMFPIIEKKVTFKFGDNICEAQ
jgi:hypothetical protein